MRSSRRRHPATLQRVKQRQDDFDAESVDQWENVAKLVVQFAPVRLANMETVDNREMVGRLMQRAEVRKPPSLDITTDMRVLIGGKTYEITGVQDVEGYGRDVELVLVSQD